MSRQTTGLPSIFENKDFTPEARIDVGIKPGQVFHVMRVSLENKVMDEFEFSMNDVDRGHVTPYTVVATREDEVKAAELGLDNVYDLFHFTPVAISVKGKMFWMRWPHLQMVLAYVNQIRETQQVMRPTADKPQAGSVVLYEDGTDTTK